MCEIWKLWKEDSSMLVAIYEGELTYGIEQKIEQLKKLLSDIQ